MLLRDGHTLPQSMRRVNVTEGDLDEDLHLRGHGGVGEIALARLERSGDISFIAK